MDAHTAANMPGSSESDSNFSASDKPGNMHGYGHARIEACDDHSLASPLVPQSVDLQLYHTVMHSIERHLLTNGTILRSPSFTTLPKLDTISSRRGFDFSLSHLTNLPSPTSQDSTDVLDVVYSSSHQRQQLEQGRDLVNGGTSRCNSFGPLTPPHDTESLNWPEHASDSVGGGPHANSESSQTSGESTTNHPAQSWAIRESDSVGPTSTLHFGAEPWFKRALTIACNAPDLDSRSTSTKVISQVLPTNASDQRTTKTYEMVCEHLHTVLPEPQYISITHALTVSPGQTVEDFPKSPPATPGHVGGDSYFGDQTVFTHAAQVPAHHEVFNSSAATLAIPQRHIMEPEANLIVLERYIPPTTIQEAKQFFLPNSMASYLADRAPELSPNHGSLMLIYPTQKGATAFARHYVGPMLDPLLREMTILKGLNTNAAERLGRMQSVGVMSDFEGIIKSLNQFCESMNTRQVIRRSRSEFVLIHSHKTEVVLDRTTWMTWFIEQEQARMKQDLVDYHRAGGRLPEAEGNNSELTAGMLAREVAESFKNSKHDAGNTGVEVGIFVLRRRRLAG